VQPPTCVGLLGCSGWLLGQEGELPGCSDADTDFVPTGCFDDTAAIAEETASGTATVGSALMLVTLRVTLLEVLGWVA
jgi:hypothetical protein